MVTRFKEEEHWGAVASLLPNELENWAQELGLIRRKRRIRDAETLVRLVMVHAMGLSLRETASWARDQGVAEVSDVALLKRFRKLPDLLSRCIQALLPPPRDMGVCLLDATTVSRPIAKGTDFRVHLSWDMEGQQVAQVRLTDHSVGETLQSLPWKKGQTIVADRGYRSRNEIAKAHVGGAKLIIRIGASGTPLIWKDGSSVDIMAQARTLKVGEFLDMDVFTAPNSPQGLPSVPGRLIILRKEPAAAERERKKARREAAKKGRKQRPETSDSAEYTFIFSTLPKEDTTAETVLLAYRHRWQIEMLFKRGKGVVSLGETLARDKELCSSVILAKLLAMLLMDRIKSSFSPWGYGIPRKSKPLADS
jgi:hypothetical protein